MPLVCRVRTAYVLEARSAACRKNMAIAVLARRKICACGSARELRIRQGSTAEVADSVRCCMGKAGFPFTPEAQYLRDANPAHSIVAVIDASNEGIIALLNLAAITSLHHPSPRISSLDAHPTACWSKPLRKETGRQESRT